ncbi:MAG: prepilin-type N-terminal cleavage/methylation domain-containing protein [bacterium]|nr:prepilin-type N-terminal cleavage/methylation domain-containing protein [bacterium]
MKFRINSKGFTLIELLLAITIAVIVGSAIYGTLAAGLKSKQKGMVIAEKNQRARVILDTIRNDLLTASVSSTTPSWQFTATTYSDGSIYQDSIQFISTNQPIDWTVSGISDEAIIKYAIDTVPNTNTVGLLRIVNRHITDPESTDINYQLISTEVKSLRFQFANDTTWVSEWTDTTILPKAVMITIATPDIETPQMLNWFTTAIRLPKG